MITLKKVSPAAYFIYRNGDSYGRVRKVAGERRKYSYEVELNDGNKFRAGTLNEIKEELHVRATRSQNE